MLLPVNKVAHGEEDDGSLRVAEPGRVHHEGEHGEGGAGETQGGPHYHPDLGEPLIVPPEHHVYAAAGCTASVPREALDGNEPGTNQS